MSQTDTLAEESIKTILVVEDDADVGEFLVQIFNDQTPYQALLAPDGFQALKMVKTLKPDLFVLDYQLPGMDGLELHDHLHDTEELQHIPTLFMSASMPAIEAEKRHASFVKKPFEFEEMLEVIKQLLTE
jgi:CheY-like chemotaxis protein